MLDLPLNFVSILNGARDRASVRNVACTHVPRVTRGKDRVWSICGCYYTAVRQFTIMRGQRLRVETRGRKSERHHKIAAHMATFLH